MYRLRKWEPGDADRLLEAFADPELAWQSPSVPTTPEQAREWIVRTRVLAEQGRAFGFAVVAGDGPVLGHVQVDVTSRVFDTGWVSYWTLAEARGRGVATAAALLVSEYAFAEVELFRLELGHRLNNPGSCLVACRAGFRPEGIQRAKLRYGDERFDTGEHARLATDPVEGVAARPCAS
ncbi:MULTISPECIES: GNAT family N-acetyltransferase [unclassified Nocardiopsis]|uniref:GNAT family N-acetyltransferase n=1 Tax=unclassified Nocardiopsis TaxID=2649073 RepID=UPI00135BA717|nr:MULTISPECIES: GNAT family N-acetyltransferase [unclassified Nocardiopsis]